MTNKTDHRRACVRTRRALALLLATVLGLGALMLGASPASAAPGTADPLAVAADAALGALARVREARTNPDYADTFPETDAALAGIVAAYGAARTEVAAKAAARAGVDPVALEASWVAAGEERTEVVLAGIAQVGVRYRYATSRPGVSFDCSGFTAYAWSVGGVSIARSSRAQIGAAAPVPLDQAQAGDLAYFTGHVMLYLGTGTAVVHSPATGRRVEVRAWYTTKRVRLGDPTR